MKKILLSVFCLCVIISCNLPTAKHEITDTRPSSQISFVKRLGGYQFNYSLSSNSSLFDKTVDSLNKLALDSLKDVKNWEFIVEEINDNQHYSKAIAMNMLEGIEIYNLILRSPIDPITEYKDSVSISENVHFMITVPKKPKSPDFIKTVAEIKSLNVGDTVLVSGSITKLNKNLEVDFSDLVKELYTNYVDIFPKSIKKKGK